MRVTERFGITGPVDFVDVHVEKDNRLFVDPSSIRNAKKAGDAWATAAHQSLVGFFDALLVRIASPAVHPAGRAMLAEFHEPKETRLGMSARGFDGSGAAGELGDRIWDAIVTNPLCLLEVPILRRVEHLPLFVEGINNDRVSDLTSRIIFTNLVDFTHQQMAKHPELVAGPAREYQVWDPGTDAWDKATFTLPDAGTHKVQPLLLVPKRVVHYSLRMNPTGFWNVPVLGAVQMSEAVRLPSGKIAKPTKKKLKEREALQEIRPTNQRWTEREWHVNQVDLLRRYEEYIDEGFDPLDDDQILRRLG